MMMLSLVCPYESCSSVSLRIMVLSLHRHHDDHQPCVSVSTMLLSVHISHAADSRLSSGHNERTPWHEPANCCVTTPHHATSITLLAHCRHACMHPSVRTCCKSAIARAWRRRTPCSLNSMVHTTQHTPKILFRSKLHPCH